MDVHSLVTNLMENCVCVQYQLGIMIIQKKYYAISVVLLYNIGVNNGGNFEVNAIDCAVNGSKGIEINGGRGI